MATSDAHSGNTEGGQSVSTLGVAAERIRESAKWLLAAFGAAGAVVFAGIALSDLGTVEEWWLRIIAVALAFLALLGVVIAVLAAGSVVTASFATVQDLARKGSADELSLAGLADVETLRQELLNAYALHRETAAALYAYLLEDNPRSEIREKLARQADAAANLVRVYEGIARPLLERQSYLQVSRAFFWAKLGMGSGVVLALVGVLGFVSITSQPRKGAPIVGATPVAVTVSVRDAYQHRLARRLGPECDLKDIRGTAIAAEGVITVVAVPATGGCNEGIYRFSPAMAVITPRSSTDG